MSGLENNNINGREDSSFAVRFSSLRMLLLVILPAFLASVCEAQYVGLQPFPYNYGFNPTDFHHYVPTTNLQIAPRFYSVAPVTRQVVTPVQRPLAPFVYTAAAPTAVIPAATTHLQAPVAAVKSQYHSQDELGGYSFGYSGGPSSRAEVKDHFGIVRGSYNYVDPENKIQSVNYVSDGLGFRVSGTNIPVAPVAPPVAIPAPIQETPEVAKARREFEEEFKKVSASPAKSRRKRSATTFLTTPAHTSLSPYPYFFQGGQTPVSNFITTPVTYSAVNAAVPVAGTTFTHLPRHLLRIINNPGHASSYVVV